MSEISKTDRNAALRAAINTLENFANKNDKSPTIADLTVKDGQIVTHHTTSIQKIMHFIGGAFSRKIRERHMNKDRQVQRAFKDAIRTVKREHLFIARLQYGDTKDQQLAQTTKEAIQRYNAVLDHRKKQQSTLTQFLARFFYRLLGWQMIEDFKASPISLPSQTCMTEGITSEENGQPIPLLTQEADAIRMKASRLLQEKGMGFKSTSATVNALRTSPIRATMHSGSSTSTLSLTLNVLPGTVIKVSGKFKRGSNSIPIADSFQLSFKSAHSGFPHPSQYTGWSLSEDLIPSYPHHLDQLPLFRPIYEQRQTIAQALLPNGELLEHAKQLLDMKRQALQQHLTIFLQKHELLCEAILTASGAQPGTAIKNFFSMLQKQENALDQLSNAWDMINGLFVKQPHTSLQEAWLNSPSSFQENAGQTAERLLQETYQRSVKELQSTDSSQQILIDFVLTIGQSIAPAAHSILLQYWSETLECAPLMLDDFAQKLQLIALIQQQHFFEEMKQPSNSEQILTECFRQLDNVNAILQAPASETIEHPLTSVVDELEENYNTSYYTSRTDKSS